MSYSHKYYTDAERLRAVNNIKVGVWTLNDLEKAKEFKRLGINYLTYA